MIGIDFTGRLGNQLFTYAFARMLMEQNGRGGDSIVANFNRCGDAGKAGWGDALHHFNVLPYSTETADLVLKYGSLSQRAAYSGYALCGKIPLVGHNDTLMSRLEQGLRRHGLHFTGAADKAYSVGKTDSKVFVRGYFQDRHFFDPIRPILLREYTPKHPPLEQNEELYRIVAQPGSICVSVRRGDYLSERYRKDFYVCTPQYFQKAIDIIRRQVDHPVFIFFSDDIQWVRQHMQVDGCPCYYESGDDPVWEKLRLMAACQHFIISNSSFAWWAQYLGTREGKIVISPRRWYANPQWHSNLTDDEGFWFADPD